MLVNGAGQRPHSYLSKGSVVDSRFTPKWDYVRGEAAAEWDGKPFEGPVAVIPF